MTHPNKAKGSRWEAAVRDYLADKLGLRLERIPAGAANDRGDISGLPNLCVECKDVAKLDFAGWVDEARAEAENVGPGVLPVVVVKRRRKGVNEAYAVMPLDAWASLFKKSLPKA